jgi:transposase
MDWIDLGVDRDRWRALVNMVMNIWVLTKWKTQTFSGDGVFYIRLCNITIVG